jgi:hypothetical protein
MIEGWFAIVNNLTRQKKTQGRQWQYELEHNGQFCRPLLPSN